MGAASLLVPRIPLGGMGRKMGKAHMMWVITLFYNNYIALVGGGKRAGFKPSPRSRAGWCGAEPISAQRRQASCCPWIDEVDTYFHEMTCVSGGKRGLACGGDAGNLNVANFYRVPGLALLGSDSGCSLGRRLIEG